MIIQSIPDTKVAGTNYKITAVDFNVGLEDQPSVISIDFVNQNGVLIPPDLDTNTPIKISIGTLGVFNYYAFSYEMLTDPSGGNTLRVTYKDGSIILDKVWVGLKNKHGYQSEYPIMIVGTEVDPCDPDQLEVDDPCNPCPNQDKITQCLELRLTKILDVEYTFNDLLQEIEDFEPNISIERPDSSIFNDNYKAKYTGSLRSVLRSWCEDYGLSFYWEDDTIKFFDLASGISINTKNLNTDAKVIKKSESKSLEGTTCNGIIGHYAQDAKKLDYNCDGNIINVLLKPINLKDISSPNSFKVYKEDYAHVENSALLNKYSTALRNVYVWNEIYQSEDHLGMRSLKDKDLRLLGMKIKEVFYKGAGGNIEKIYSAYLEEIDKLSENTELGVNLKEFIERGGYFMLVEYSEDTYSNVIQYEKDVANLLMGKYYIRRYGGQGRNMTWQSPEGSVQFYEPGRKGTGGHIIDLPFARLITNYQNGRKEVYNSPLFKQVDGNLKVTDTFLLLERSPPWYPLNSVDLDSDSDSSSLAILIKQAEEAIGKEIEMLPFNFFDQYGEKKKLKMLTMFPSKNFSFSVNRSKSNIYDIDKKNLRYTDHGGIANYGLRDARCITMTLRGSDGTSLIIQGPSQGFSTNVNLNPHGGYLVIGKPNSNNSNYLRKKELVVTRLPEDCDEAAAININMREIRQELTRIIDSQECKISDEKLTTLINNFIDKLSPDVDIPLEEKKYTVSGIPEDTFKISNGLNSFAIRITSSGFITDLNFKNRSPKKISSNIIIKRMESLINDYVNSNNNFRSIFNNNNTISGEIDNIPVPDTDTDLDS